MPQTSQRILSHGSVEKHHRWRGNIFNWLTSQISSWRIWRWKNFENRIMFAKFILLYCNTTAVHCG